MFRFGLSPQCLNMFKIPPLERHPQLASEVTAFMFTPQSSWTACCVLVLVLEAVGRVWPRNAESPNPVLQQLDKEQELHRHLITVILVQSQESSREQ